MGNCRQTKLTAQCSLTDILGHTKGPLPVLSDCGHLLIQALFQALQLMSFTRIKNSCETQFPTAFAYIGYLHLIQQRDERHMYQSK